MLLLRLFLLVHAIVAVEREWNFGTYVIKTDKKILKSIRTTDSFDYELNLSNLGLVGLDKNAFDNNNLNSLQRLNISNNWLTTIPEFVFSNLPNLQYLSLSDNNITSNLQNAFNGLIDLKSLDMSNNQLTHLKSNHFAGLPSSPDILVGGNFISNMSTPSFRGIFLRNEPLPKGEVVTNEKNDTEEHYEFRVKVCYDSERHPDRLDYNTKNVLPRECDEARMNISVSKLFFRNLDIQDPNGERYGLQDFPSSSIDLSQKHLKLYSSPFFSLKSLPQNIKEVNLSNYRWYFSSRLHKSIENENLRSLSLEENYISEIGPLVFEKMNLTFLNLAGKDLRDLKFVDSLPSSLLHLNLSDNRIEVESDDTFSKLHRLVYLSLSSNKIDSLSNQIFRGLSSLQYLNLANNKVKFLDSAPFYDLKNLRYLVLSENEISSIDKGLYTGLGNIEIIDLADNYLSEITPNTLYGLSDALLTVILDRNRITRLEDYSFVRVPKHTLSLDGNKIESIKTRCFNLPSLQELRLSDNQLPKFSSWGNLKSLKRLSLASNKISEIEKRATSNMGQLEYLNLTDNYITKLPNGAFSGISKRRPSVIYLNKMKIQLVQGGVFDPV